MKVLVCGSRHFNDYSLLERTLDEYPITTVIEGEARGADKLSAVYAESRDIPVERYPADWGKYGTRAGPIRNSQMLKEGKPEFVVAFRGPNSRGTQNMIDQSLRAGVEVRVIDFI